MEENAGTAIAHWPVVHGTAEALHPEDEKRARWDIWVELIGWSSSAILLLTIVKQIRTQWVSRSSEGVSKWLFVGQVAASLGFTAYSVLLQNWVFVVTNVLMFLSACLGALIVARHRK